MRDLIGRTLGHYRIVDKIGEGGMGEVYRAHDERLDRDVAVKVLPEEVAQSKSRLARFEREAKAVAALSHTNILEIFDFDTEDEVTYAVTELLEGETLCECLSKGRGPLSWRRAQKIATAVANGLGAAHGKGVVHRDIKPSNIFLCADGRLKILDFGLAASQGVVDGEAETESLAVTLTGEGKVLGTVGYMSPEQVRGEQVDHRSDIFALGCVLYEMVTARRAFPGKDPVSVLSSILRDEPVPPREVAPSTPEGLEDIVFRCLEKSPEDRYSSTDELLEVLTVPEGTVEAPDRAPLRSRRLGAFRVFVMIAAVFVLVVLGLHWSRQRQRARWVDEKAIPELEEIVDQIQGYDGGPEPWAAFELARRIEEVDPDNPRLENLWPRFSNEIPISTVPPGAKVWVRYYGWSEAESIFLGETPIEGIRLPRSITRLRLELAGHRVVEDARPVYKTREQWHYPLHTEGDMPEGMVWVPSGQLSLGLSGLHQFESEPTAAFLVDRFEVTNQQYQRFVDGGGYENPDYWKHPFLADGGELSWEEAMARFTDRTGRQGPATWEVGKPPIDSEDFPVTGVSWYEAAAYAAWAGKSLPTIFHWNRVALFWPSHPIVLESNLNGEGPIPVGASGSLNRFGAYDLAGNVREWVWNGGEVPGQRFILGGGWNDPDYAFVDSFAQPAFDRSPTNGFRCILNLEDDPNRLALSRNIERLFRDFFAETPVSDEVFTHFLSMFSYDKTPLAAVVEAETEVRHGRRLKISFEAAYGGERMLAYLFLPDQGNPPYQTIILFPGSGGIHTRSSEHFEPFTAEFGLASGRAVLCPIYKGTFERGSGLVSDYPDKTALYRDHVIMWGKDVARSIDYLETREDIDSSRLAFFGYSWGGIMGAIIPAIEPRFKAVILCIAGLDYGAALPEADQINYVTRVTQPTLMLTGELDFFFPVETSQRPMFELLGTPNEHKRWVLYPRGHWVPRVEMIKESLAWLDRYLGLVGSGNECEDP
jgi:serine/threonine protein kinase/formylglycine-generating enzyme required for sulfatase activity/dienelactone hydrolase